MPANDLLLIAVLLPFVAGAVARALGRWPRARDAATSLAAVAAFAATASLLPAVREGRPPALELFPIVPGFALALRADSFGLLFALVASGLWVVTSVYNAAYMRAEGDRDATGYFALFAASVGAALGIALSANLVTLFVFYEVLTLSTWPLVVHKRTPEARAAGRKYLAYTLASGQALLVAVVAASVLAPGAGFRAGGFLAGTAGEGPLRLLFLLFVAGCGVKAAIMPLHAWLPAAMVAPTPVSALLHAVAVVKAGTFVCVRVVGWVFGVDVLRQIGADVALATLAAATIVLASVRALGEMNLKRRLAWSTVGQLSYIVLGAALGSAAALAGAMFHLAAHGLMKITLFFCAGSIYVRTHLTEIPALTGVGRRMPVTMAAFAVAALGLTGIPGLAGFVSKWHLGVGALDAGHGVFLAVLVVSGVLNAAYFLPIVQAAFAGEGPLRFEEASPGVWAPLALTAAASIVIGLAPGAALGLYELAWEAARSVVAGARP